MISGRRTVFVKIFCFIHSTGRGINDEEAARSSLHFRSLKGDLPKHSLASRPQPPTLLPTRGGRRKKYSRQIPSDETSETRKERPAKVDNRIHERESCVFPQESASDIVNRDFVVSGNGVVRRLCFCDERKNPSPALSLEGPALWRRRSAGVNDKKLYRVTKQPGALAYERRARRVSEKASSSGTDGTYGRMDGKTKR